MNGSHNSFRPEHLAYKPPAPKKQFSVPKGKKLYIIVIAIIVLEGIATELYLKAHRKPPPLEDYTSFNITQEDSELTNPAEQKKLSAVVEAVQKKIALPEGETPIIATVSDPAALKNQKFFAAAQIGDKILMYRTAKKAFLYRPAEDKVIAQAPLKYEADVAGSSTTAAPSQ